MLRCTSETLLRVGKSAFRLIQVWENDIDVIRITGFADVQTISVSAIKKLTAYANGAQVPQLHQRKNQV